jgi:hypothetical protein
LISDGCTANSFIMLDAHQVAAASGTIELSASGQSTLQFETAPDSPTVASSTLKSLWQHNLTALIAGRFFGAELLRTTACAIVINLSYSGNSPA